MSRSIKDLGNTQRCPKCNNFAKMTGLIVSAKATRASYQCETCTKKYKHDYAHEEFINMAKSFLIDDEWIPEFQRKYMIITHQGR